jgi:hypothetical protein
VVAALEVDVAAVPASVVEALAAVLRRWGAAPATRRLQRWLIWVTGSDVLDAGQRLGVEFLDGGGFPQAQTCTKTICLPDVPGATPTEVEAKLEELLGVAMQSEEFTTE